MRLRTLPPCLAALLALAPAGAAIQQPGQGDPPAAAPEAAEPAPTPAQPSAPAEAPAEAANPPEAPEAEQPELVRALQSLDLRRLETDRAYAESIVRHLEEADRLIPAEAEGRQQFDGLRLYAMAAAGRDRDARRLLQRMIAAQPNQAQQFAMPWFSALRLEDYDQAVAIAELASRNVRAGEWQPLREIFDPRTVWPVIHHFSGERGRAQRTRLAEALFRIGWPGRDDPQGTDALRILMIDDRLARSDMAGASDLAAGITSVSNMLSLILQRKYDGIVGARDRQALLAGAIEEEDRATAAALAAAPDNLKRVLDRATFLRGQARERDALALLEPFTRDVPATVARADEGMWVVNQAAYSLVALGRGEEGAALTGALAAMPVAERPDLIGPSINHSVVLWAVGRHADALAHATRLDREPNFANDYGRMWIVSSAVCALNSLGRAGEIAPWLRRLRDGERANPAALTRAYLCLDDMEAAEAVMLRRLAGDDLDLLLRSLQDYRLGQDFSGANDPLYGRFIALRDRPAVRAAIERRGRILALPLSRTYWGGN